MDLKGRYNLDVSTDEKPATNVDDVYLILYHLWAVDTATFPDGRQRLQIALLMLLTACTATRPGALVYVRRSEKRIRGYCICEGDEEKDEIEEKEECEHGGNHGGDSDWDDESDKNTLLLGHHTTITLQSRWHSRLAGHGRKCRSHLKDIGVSQNGMQCLPGSTLPTIFVTHAIHRKDFVQSEVDDLVFDTVILMIVLAILDDAFKSDIESVEQIFGVRIRAPRRSVKLKFKRSIAGCSDLPTSGLFY